MSRKTPKILHIRRDLSNRPFLRQMWGELRRLFFFYDQEGYFDASMHEVFPDITTSTAQTAFKRADRYSREFNLMVVNNKTDTLTGKSTSETLKRLGNTFDIPSVLVMIDADASCIPADEVCDAYDLIFRRECFSDTDRYDLSETNKKKLRTTMLPCLFVPLPRSFLSSFVEPLFIPQAPNDLDQLNKEHDVFFCGQYDPVFPIRLEVVRALKQDPDINFYGGLQPKDEEVDVPEEVAFERLSPDAYVRAMKRSRIVLALDGFGQFTFRHLEAWHFGGFLMSSPSIRGVNVPLPAEEGTHYVAFDDTDNLKEQVKHYLNHEDERKRIAEAGEEMFEQSYDPQLHGQYIARQVEDLIQRSEE